MKITGEFYIFVEDKKDKENKVFKTFSTSISTKLEDGSYLHKSIEVRLDRENFPAATTSKFNSQYVYKINMTDGWMGVRAYKNKDGEERKQFYLYVKSAECLDKKKIEKKDNSQNDLPF